MAGLNASLFNHPRQRGWSPRRDQAYMGVLIDTLSTMGTKEPYRMFTSVRNIVCCFVKHNAYDPSGQKNLVNPGLVDDARPARFKREDGQHGERASGAWKRLADRSKIWRYWRAEPDPKHQCLVKRAAKIFASSRNDGLASRRLWSFFSSTEHQQAAEQVEIQVKYEGYIQRQQDGRNWKITASRKYQNCLLILITASKRAFLTKWF